MNVPQEELNRWRQNMEAIRVRCFAARQKVRGGSREASDLLMECAHLSAVTGSQMEQAGAERPGDMGAPPETPLRLLDTPTNRAYMDALRVAWMCAVAVDKERYGAEIGMDGPAQVIEMVLRGVEQEVHGAVGGRE